MVSRSLYSWLTNDIQQPTARKSTFVECMNLQRKIKKKYTFIIRTEWPWLCWYYYQHEYIIFVVVVSSSLRLIKKKKRWKKSAPHKTSELASFWLLEWKKGIIFRLVKKLACIKDETQQSVYHILLTSQMIFHKNTHLVVISKYYNHYLLST